MMHLEAIIRRNKRPVPQPTANTSKAWDAAAQDRIAKARANKRPWDAPDPLPEDEAHPR